MVGKFIKRTYTFLMFLFLYAPIIILIVFSFNDSRSRGKWGGFTLRWYKELLYDSVIKNAFYYTITIAILTAIISTIIGTIAAVGIHDMKLLGKNVVLNINYIPVLNPEIVTGVSLMTLFIFLRLELGFLSMLLAHIAFSTPYVVLAVLPKLKQLNKHLAEAAMDLGATPFYAFRKVILPEIMPGIVTGALMAFTLSIDDFVISFFTTGKGVSNLSITVYSMARRGINPKINALTTLMFLGVLMLLLIINKRTTAESKNARK